jgi:hypothetical protein
MCFSGLPMLLLKRFEGEHVCCKFGFLHPDRTD